MLYLLAFFLSPLALLLAAKPIQAVINAVIYFAAWIGLFVFVVPGVILWAIGVAHAVMVINNQRQEQRTQRVVDAIQSRQQ
jgi:hypothetical protein